MVSFDQISRGNNH